MKKKYIKTLARFIKDSKIEELGIETKDNNLDWNEFVFDLNEVVNFNRSENGFATIVLSNCYDIVIAIIYEDFEELISKENDIPIKEIINSKIKYEHSES